MIEINRLLDYTQPWELPDVYLFTGNSIVKHNGAIVMGRGAAKQVRDFFPGIDKVFGSSLLQARIDDIYEPSLLFAVEGKQMIGWFRVKNHWAEPAKLEIIELSCEALTAIAIDCPDKTFHMNYPGIGNGRLDVASVELIVEVLPDNVWLYRVGM